MESHEKYLQDLKQWLHDTSDSPLEEMSDFIQSDWKIMRNIYLFGKNLIKCFRKFCPLIARTCRFIVYFDIPLTLEHERELLQNVGFVLEKVLDNPDGATIIVAGKGD